MSCARHLMVARAMLTPDRGAAPFDRSDMQRVHKPDTPVDTKRRSFLRLPAVALAGLLAGRAVDEAAPRKPRRD